MSSWSSTAAHVYINMYIPKATSILLTLNILHMYVLLIHVSISQKLIKKKKRVKNFITLVAHACTAVILQISDVSTTLEKRLNQEKEIAKIFVIKFCYNDYIHSTCCNNVTIDDRSFYDSLF